MCAQSAPLPFNISSCDPSIISSRVAAWSRVAPALQLSAMGATLPGSLKISCLWGWVHYSFSLTNVHMTQYRRLCTQGDQVWEFRLIISGTCDRRFSVILDLWMLGTQDRLSSELANPVNISIHTDLRGASRERSLSL